MVSVLFSCDDSIYKTMPELEVWDKERNALNFTGNGPVIAHPPCRSWGSLRNHAKPEPGEKEYAIWAIEQVRKNGGVLEHPAKSTLWPVAGLPEPGQIDRYGGWTLVVDQHWFGHRAQKRTRLYIVGCKRKDIPCMPMVLGRATHTVGLWSGRNRATCRPSILKREYEATPVEFAEWLVELAKKCRN